MSTSDLVGSIRLFDNLFGFANAGGSAMWGEAMRVAGLDPSARTLVWWLVGSRPFFQLELFEYTYPVPAPLTTTDGAADLRGWTGIGIAVPDFDRVTSGLTDFGIEPAGTTTGPQGARRISFREPFGGFMIEAVEAPARSGCDVIYATQVVDDLIAARRLYEGILGVRTEPPAPGWRPLAAHEGSFLAHVGEFVIEVLKRVGPTDVQPRRRVFDYGIVNLALGSREGQVAADLIERLRADGHQATAVTNLGDIVGTYFVDPGCEFEILSLPAEYDDDLGYTVGPTLLANMGF